MFFISHKILLHTNAQFNQEISGELQRKIKLEGIINTYFDKDLDYEKFSELLFISKRQLSRIVKKQYGSSLHRVITEKRISAAKMLLVDTGKSVEEVSQAVGFSNKNSFYREFRKSHGITPLKYRKMNCG